MARFPRREADIRTLVQNIIAGLKDNPDFPNPPFSPEQLQTFLDDSIALEDTQVAALAAAQQATEAKQAGNDKMISAAKSVLNYAEDAVHGNDAKLAALGWSGRAESTPLQIPGQPRTLEAPKEGPGWLFLDWKKSPDGGKAAFFRVERRKPSSEEWMMVGTALETEITLNNQERGKEYEYRVIAVNKAGESEASNTVTAVL
jgi:fibronectin type 3 domain-containing protein